MIRSLLHSPTTAWLALMVLTLSGFLSAEYGTLQVVAVAAVMALSAIKARIVLYQFMELGSLPLALQVFFNAWLVVCAGMIVGLFAMAL